MDSTAERTEAEVTAATPTESTPAVARASPVEERVSQLLENDAAEPSAEPSETVQENNPNHELDTASLPPPTTSLPVPPVVPSLAPTAGPTAGPTAEGRQLQFEHSPSSAPLSRVVSPSTASRPRPASSKSPERAYTAPWAARPPPSPAAANVPALPRPTLLATVHDLRTLLKSFLVLIPSSLRRLKFLLPSPILRLARLIIESLAMTLHKRGALASNMFFDLLVVLWTTMIHLFFREIRSRGAWKIPREGEGAVIFVVGPHHNQFLDPLLLISEVRREAGRRISFLVAAKSMARKFVGISAKLMQSIPVARAQDMATNGTGSIKISSDDPLIVLGVGTKFTTEFEPKMQIMLNKHFGHATVEVVEVIDDTTLRIKKEFNEKSHDGINAKEGGVSFKILPYVDQTKMYSSVYQKLKEGGCIGIFPEGGSHDRTDLLPLKAGVSIMALGALSANPSLRLRIVPVGLSYFHPHKFRSRAVVEFGSPIEIPREFVEDFERGGEAKKGAIGGMMELVVDGLKSVTVRAPDYETLMLIQATRRLYRPPGQHLTLGQIVELNKRFIAGYEVYKEEPVLKDLVKRVKEYNTLLRYMGLKDHQIERVARPLWRSILLLCYRTGLFAAWGTLALPGVILNGPIFIAASFISHMKAREALAASTVKIKGNDVLATWKVLVALAGAPALYSIYAGGATVLAFKYDLPPKYKLWAPIATMAGLPLIGYSALKFGEVGVDVYKSLRPLFLSVIPGNVKQLDKIRVMRAALQVDIDHVVNEFGPQLFEDFQRTRIVTPAAVPAPVSPTLTRRRSTYGAGGQGTFLTHPLSWLDDLIFGWASSQATAASSGDSDDVEPESGMKSGYTSGYNSGYNTEGDPDYDEVIHILAREMGGPDPVASEPGTPRYRSSSRNRSRSHLDLTAVDDKIKGSGGARKRNVPTGSGASTPVKSYSSRTL